jgi:hypothetical protein
MFSAGVTSHKYAPSCWRIPDMGVDLPSTFETSLARKSIAPGLQSALASVLGATYEKTRALVSGFLSAAGKLIRRA